MRALQTTLLAVGLLALFGCPDQVSPQMDASMPPEDGGVPPQTITLDNANLAPAAQSAESGEYRLRGHLKSSGGQTAESNQYQIRGGFVPLTR